MFLLTDLELKLRREQRLIESLGPMGGISHCCKLRRTFEADLTPVGGWMLFSLLSTGAAKSGLNRFFWLEQHSSQCSSQPKRRGYPTDAVALPVQEVAPHLPVELGVFNVRTK